MSFALSEGGLQQAGSAESEYGANAALTELEKGLRSTKIGEQAEAIVRFPHLFSQYPFPIFINSGMLKLAELFNRSSNFLKLCVLRVCQQSSLHLDKVTSVDELVRRIITVINSNDPVARALTLRVLGSIAPIIPERKAGQVHHKVRCSLDSLDQVELYAGIFATKKFAATSRTFSTDICPKLLELVRSPATSLPVKLRLLPTFQHMHQAAGTAAEVRAALLELLPLHPGRALTSLTLHTLTRLARHTRLHIPGQVSLLLQHLADGRQQVRLSVLSDLALLASQDSAHHWTEKHLEAAVQFASTAQCEEGSCRALEMVRDIVTGQEGESMTLHTNSGLLQLASQAAYSARLPVAARGTELLSVLAAHQPSLASQAVLAIENLCFLLDTEALQQEDVRRCLQCVLMLCRHQPDLTGQFVDILGGTVVRLERGEKGGRARLHSVVETLAALGSLTPGVLASIVPDILQLAQSNTVDAPSLVLLLTLLLQTLRGTEWPSAARQTVETILARMDCWEQYRVGRAASRYGHHGLAASIFSEVAQVAESDSCFSWLEGLGLLARAEATLASPSLGLQQRLAASITLFHRAISSLRCATSPAFPLAFQLEFVSCRLELVTVLAGLVGAATSLSTSPPPAIAAALAQQSRDELQRCGRVTPQLRQVIKQLNICAANWVRLSESSFDSDDCSLALISVQKQAILSLATWVEMVCLKSPLQGNIYTDTELEFCPDLSPRTGPASIELADLISNVQSVARSFHALASNQSPLAKPISHLHTSCLTEVVATLTSHPAPYPRFFYQSLQQTKLKLAVTPQPRTAGEPVPVNTSQYLAVKVEGVMVQGTGSRPQSRTVAGVLVQLTSNMQKPAEGKSVKQETAKGEGSGTSTILEQVVEPHNNFFTAQFLVPFPNPGLYTVNIDTQWKDKQGAAWRTGVKCSITVKSFEDRTNNNRTITR